jgi:polysaccharide biosynthesis protein PslH
MNSALFISAEAPYPLAGGGAMRSASLLNFLARRLRGGYDRTFREPRAADPRIHLPPGLVRRLHVVDLPPHARHTIGPRRAQCRPPGAARSSPDRPFRRLRRPNRRRHPRAALRNRGHRALLVRAVLGASRGRKRRHHPRPAQHRIGAACTLRAGRKRRGRPGKRLAHRAFQKSAADLEEEWLPRFTYLLAASEPDAELLRDDFARLACVGLPEFDTVAPAPPRKMRGGCDRFSGNLEYHPNVSAVRYFREEIWPELRARWPGLVWRLIGKNPQAVAKIVSGDPRIELSGPVEDAVLELARAKVAIVPLLAGSGTRVKIIEAWAAGVPVVSTPLGAEGLPARAGEHLLLADDAPGFRDAVSSLLASPALRDRIGRAGRYLFECEFTWEAAWKNLQFLYPATMVRSDALRD